MGRKKQIIFFAVTIISFCSSGVYSQSVYSQSKYGFSTGVFGGFTLRQNRSDFAQKSTAGFNYGLDLEARIHKLITFIEAAYNPENQSSDGILELSAGPRWSLGGKDFYSSVEAGLGLYKFRSNSEWGTSYMGLNVGAGANIMLSKNTDLFLKAKYHFVGFKYVTSYSGIYMGIRFYFKK